MFCYCGTYRQEHLINVKRDKDKLLTMQKKKKKKKG
jgi:hypothetical protein